MHCFYQILKVRTMHFGSNMLEQEFIKKELKLIKPHTRCELRNLVTVFEKFSKSKATANISGVNCHFSNKI